MSGGFSSTIVTYIRPVSLLMCIAAIWTCVYLDHQLNGNLMVRLSYHANYPRKVKHGISWRPNLETVSLKESGCLPNKRVVFIKTHKTGSTTTAAIFERFGFRRNLSFAMNSKSHFFHRTKLFHHSMAFKVPYRYRQDFDLLVNHARFYKKEMAIAVPNAKYISIIRNPVNQLESAFGYFEMDKRLKIKTKQPFITFIMNPMKYLHEKSHLHWLLKNGQLFDLGLDTKYHENLTVVRNKIKQLSTEIHLIMLNEYYDESMILLKKLMCWDFEDVLYTKHGIRSKSHRSSINKTTEAKIKEWNAGDVMLYDHFNRTFWEKIRAYGPTFSDDLAHLRAMLKNVSDMCIDPVKRYLKDERVEEFMLKPNPSKYCQDLMRNDVQYTKLIRNGMVKRARAPI